MRRILTAITAAALALSLLGSTASAAVAGYNSAYAGESAFLTLSQGQSGTFTVFFSNNGTTTWTTGTATQVDLAACLDDKVTCNVQDTAEAGFNSGWLSAARYATHTQTSVAPGQIGTFTYNVAVPAGQAAGTYRFNGALVLASSGADIRNEGYFQDVTVPTAAAAATLTSLTPVTGTVAGGTAVTITGTGFSCTPSFPTVTFDTSAATVTSCGATTITATSPAHAAGTVNVTVTNTGAAASNALGYTYADTTRPTFNSISVAGSTGTVTFSEPVCNAAATNTAAADWTVTVNGAAIAVTDESAPTCNSLTAATNGVTSFNIFLASAATNGGVVIGTLNATSGSVNANIQDAAGNTATAPRSNSATASAAETTAPTITSASGNGGSTTLTLNFSEPVWCADALDAGDVSVTTGSTTILSTATNTCGATAGASATSFTVTLASALASSTGYTVTVTTTANELQDASGNDIATTASTSFTSGVADASAPTMTDTRVTTNAGLTTNMDSNDIFTITFSEAMNTVTAGDTINLQDTDNAPAAGDIATVTCGVNATCVFNSAGTVLTVTITAAVVSTTGDLRISYPATITSLGGFSDTAGNAPNVSGSADRIIDIEA